MRTRQMDSFTMLDDGKIVAHIEPSIDTLMTEWELSLRTKNAACLHRKLNHDRFRSVM